MAPAREVPEPDIEVLVAELTAADARFVVIGGFAVIANRFIRATEDIDLLIPEDAVNDSRLLAALTALDAVRLRDRVPVRAEHLAGQWHLRAVTRAGLVDLLREGESPLDFESARRAALPATAPSGREFLVAGLATLVGFKRLAGRPQDRRDLEELERIHGPLPIVPLPGLDP